MATPQSPDKEAAMISQMASGRLGPDPAAAQDPASNPQPAPAPQQGKPAEKPAEKPDTEQGRAEEQGSPQTEGDKMNEDPVLYKVKMGDQDRDLTPEQIASTFSRYSELNYKNAQMKPVTQLAEALMQRIPDATPEKVASIMAASLKAQMSNPQMGRGSQGQPAQNPGSANTEAKGDGRSRSAEDISAMMDKWEQDNAASLPPGYRELVTQMNQSGQLGSEVQQMKQILKQLVGQSQGVADAARDTVSKTNQDRVATIRQQIGTNLDRVQQHLQIPGEAANDFMVFASERGYTLEDFIDPNLALKVMQDFKANKDSPEMERLRSMAQRRQAYTGAVGSSPSAPPSGPADPQSQRFDSFANDLMAKKGLA